MVTTSSNRGFSIPTVGGDAGVWGGELNTTITDMDTIVGGSISFNSSGAATVTLTASEAQFNRIVFTGTPASSMVLNVMTNAVTGGYGNFNVWNNTSTSANGGAGFNIVVQVCSTSTGTTVTIPVSNMRMVNIDNQNAQFADQVVVPVTTLPPILNGYLYGLGTINSTIGSSAGSSTTFIQFASGIATDSSAIVYMQNSAALAKSASAAWVLGALNGGMGNGLSFSAATTYHMFIISNGTSSNIDFYFDTSATAANKPNNTNYWRRIFSMKSASSAAAWPAYNQNGDDVLLNTPGPDLQSGTIGTSSAGTINLISLPTGIELLANVILNVTASTVGANTAFFYPGVSSPLSSGAGGQANVNVVNVGVNSPDRIRCNTSAQIFAISFVAATTVFVDSHGWTDFRGKFAVP